MAPFRQLLLDPFGNAYPCCYHYGYRLGNLKRSSMDDIWNSQKLSKLQNDMMSGRHAICRSRISSGCYRDFDHFKQGNSQDSIPQLKRLDLRLGGHCQLQCIMCDVWKQPNDTYDETQFWQEGPENIFPFLKEVDLLGGEPLIQDATFRLIKEVRNVNKSCQFSFVTNGMFPWRGRIANTLNSIPLKRIQLSLDSLNPSTYTKIRKGGQLKLPLQTLSKLQDLRSSYEQRGERLSLKISMCVMQANWQEVPHFLAYSQSENLVPEFQYAHYDPSQKMSLSFLPSKERQNIENELKASIPREHWPLLQPVFQGLRVAKNPR